VYAVLAVIVVLMSVFWQRLLLLTLNEELAKAEGLKHLFYQLLFMLMIALTVSVSVQIVGVLLITSLLIIPPAVARVFASSPAQMVFLSIIISIIAVIVGLNSSMHYDVATGPAIVITLGILFGLSQLFLRKNLT
jgi:zinc transport system permease protein